jgi:hypothetical protein
MLYNHGAVMQKTEPPGLCVLPPAGVLLAMPRQPRHAGSVPGPRPFPIHLAVMEIRR